MYPVDYKTWSGLGWRGERLSLPKGSVREGRGDRHLSSSSPRAGQAAANLGPLNLAQPAAFCPPVTQGEAVSRAGPERAGRRNCPNPSVTAQVTSDLGIA